MTDELMKILTENREFFQNHGNGSKFCEIFETLIEIVINLETFIEDIRKFAGNYDLDEKTPGNGYRSFVIVADKALRKVSHVSKKLQENREKLFFRRKPYENELSEYQQLLLSLTIIAGSLKEIHEKSGSSLYSEIGVYNNTMRKTMNDLNLEAFYGRIFGFHLPRSIAIASKNIAVVMSTYSEYFYSNERKLLKLIRWPINIVKYYWNKNLLAKRLVEIFENAQVEYLYRLTNLAEIKPYGLLQYLTEPKIPVNHNFLIHPEPLKMFSEKLGKFVEIPIPESHIGEKPITCRLFSSRKRDGMKQATRAKNGEKSKHLIIHCHGGGWVSQTPKYHGSYLKDWAIKLDIPILSIDYSLAHEAPFPRALEEVFYAYCWALKNAELLGSTGENIVLVGDSAGGNLITACTIKCIESGIPVPKGLLNIYAVFLANFVTAPSRYLGLMDVILAYTTYNSLFPAYQGKIGKSKLTDNRQIPKLTIDESFKVSTNHLFSPHYTNDEIIKEFPPTVVLSTTFDPCLDEAVEFAKKLRKSHVNFKLDVLEDLHHGFLHFSLISARCQKGSEKCVEHMLKLFEM